VGVFDKPGVVGAGRRLVGQGFPGRVIGPEKPTPLVLMVSRTLGGVHRVVGPTAAFGRKKERGGEPGASIGRGILIGENQVGDVVAGDMALKKGLVLADLGADIGGGPIAGHGVGVVQGMVEDVPSRRP
jgi:hypothetical protein